ncbi:MAG: HEAT repeat domain-containing protein [Sandaracinaceae bacterium]|nr:HEAT repeat domain-containing protein [Sandaracinaceae bacterium]
MKRFGLPFALLVLLASPAAAQPADPQGELARSLDALGRQGGREAVQQIEARVAQGLPPPLLARAVAALAQIGDRYAVSALLSLASHRRAVVRAQVAEALGRSRDARARGPCWVISSTIRTRAYAPRPPSPSACSGPRA